MSQKILRPSVGVQPFPAVARLDFPIAVEPVISPVLEDFDFQVVVLAIPDQEQAWGLGRPGLGNRTLTT
jgi:hypothetical protein